MTVFQYLRMPGWSANSLKIRTMLTGPLQLKSKSIWVSTVCLFQSMPCALQTPTSKATLPVVYSYPVNDGQRKQSVHLVRFFADMNRDLASWAQ